MINHYEIDQQGLSETFFVPITGKKKETPVITATLDRIKIDGIRLPSYESEACCDYHNRFEALDHALTDKLRALIALLAYRIWNELNTLPVLAKIVSLESRIFYKGLTLLWGKPSLKAAWNEPDHLMLQMMEYNLIEFSASKTEARLASMTQLLIDKENYQIRSFEAFKQKAMEITKNFNETWLRTEYNLAVATGQNASAYVRFMAEKDTVTSFVQYQTAGDERVRSSHRLLDGKIFSLNDKEAMRLWPPNGYGCRCEMLQYTGPVKGRVSRGEEFIHQMPESFFKGFDYNRGDLKQVFVRKQFYTKEGKLLKEFNNLTYKDYGLEDFADIQKDKPPLKLDETITEKNVAELFKETDKDDKGKPFMGFKDYLNRRIKLFKDTFDYHTNSKKHYIKKEERRHQIFAILPDILEKPDEVWMTNLNKKNTWQIKYVKHFKNMTIIVDTHFNELKGLELKTWYQLKTNEIRKGLLLNNKPF